MRKSKRTILAAAVIILAAMMMMTGCKKKAAYKNPVPENGRNGEFQEEEASSAAEAAGEDSGISYSDHETLDEAVQESGISLALPEVDGYHADRYSNIGTSLIEALFSEDTAPAGEDTNQFIIRRQPTETAEDISGDDTAYQTEAVSEFGGCNVTIRSQDGKGYVAVWYTNGSSWAVVSRYGMDVDTFAKMVSETVALNNQ